MSDTPQADPYRLWRAGIALTAGRRVMTRDEMSAIVITHEPECGFFRKRVGRGGTYVPVAIWPDGNGGWLASVNGRMEDAAEVWTYCCSYPILEEDYRKRAAGEPWWDEDTAVTESLSPPSIGHNRGPEDEADILKGQIEAAAANITDYAEIGDDETAGKAQSLRSRLLELAGTAEKRHKKEKEPHLEAGRKVDKKWFPLRDIAREAADKLRAALSAHETRKARALAEAERISAEARRMAEAEAMATAPAQPAPPAPQPPAPPTAKPAAQIRGAYGKAAAVKVVKVAVVEDYDEATTFFRDELEYRAVINKLAQRAVDAGITVPGVKIEERRDVR